MENNLRPKENKLQPKYEWVSSTGNLKDEDGLIPLAHTPDASFNKQKISRETKEKENEIFKNKDTLLYEHIKIKEQKLASILKESMLATDKVARQAKKIEADHLRTEIKDLKSKQTKFPN